MSAEDAFSDSFRSGGLVFFAGAGVSYESGAATPIEVLNASFNLFFPPGADFALDRNSVLTGECPVGLNGIQPEVFYEHLLHLRNETEALALWRILSPRWLRQRNCAWRPNANHFAIAAYAAAHGVPVFTTNFDLLFEMAAADLNLPLQVILPGTPVAPAVAAMAQPGLLRLFKLHGTVELDGVERLDTLRTTMQGISAVNLPMLDLMGRLCETRTLAFAGYSGCDIDYFPVLAGKQFTRHAFWFNPLGDRATTERAGRIDARSIARRPSEFFAEIGAVPFSGKAPPQSSESLAKRRTALLDELKAKMSVRLSTDQKLLLLAHSLQSIGRNERAEAVLAKIDAKGLALRDRVDSLLLHARIKDCLSDYSKCEASATAALELTTRARRTGTLESAEARALLIRALYQRGMARQQQIGPIINYGNRRLDWRPTFSSMLRRLVGGLWLSLHFWWLRRRLPQAASDWRGLAYVRAEQVIEDHNMMVAGGITTFLTTLRLVGLPLVRVALRKHFRRVAERAGRKGDYFAYAHSLKYLRRIGGLTVSDEASETYGLLRDPLNYALVHRDAGVAYLTRLDRDAAEVEFLEAFAAAQACGSKATALKALVGLAACGRASEADLGALTRLGPAIEGAGYRRYWERVLRPWLAETGQSIA